MNSWSVDTFIHWADVYSVSQEEFLFFAIIFKPLTLTAWRNFEMNRKRNSSGDTLYFLTLWDIEGRHFENASALFKIDNNECDSVSEEKTGQWSRLDWNFHGRIFLVFIVVKKGSTFLTNISALAKMKRRNMKQPGSFRCISTEICNLCDM